MLQAGRGPIVRCMVSGMTSTLLPPRTAGLALALVLTVAWSPLARAEVATPPPSNGAPASTPPASAPEDNGAVIARILAGITRVGPGSATMSRESRDLILSNLAILARSARAVPANDNGALGFRLFGIRSGSVLAALGLRNGDLLKSINGRPTTTPQEVLAAYAGLRGASSWTLSISRRGADMTLAVRVVNDAPAGATPPTGPTPSGGARPSAP